MKEKKHKLLIWQTQKHSLLIDPIDICLAQKIIVAVQPFKTLCPQPAIFYKLIFPGLADDDVLQINISQQEIF